ncbi:tetratricopeptide repeat protein [Arcticibacterium luteifluviistationis]|uniref:Uncharacterized protein n=1 Tax=Arcticibacterium luteifluviistationis TaxID=1784714 RepID=A0A2Z4G926_9BACT|nr:tetratricopeptide repeat protein [Arcticibacterium luteifluviistationis]AWV97749.1 hypothetical protein DJ013_06040 [Arcticibacterium luteifluviistationis]
MRKTLALILLVFFVSDRVQAQFSNDEISKRSTINGLDKLYNLEFREAERFFEPVIKKYGEHPVAYLIKATSLQYEFAPIEQNPVRFKEYIANLEKCIKLANEQYEAGKYKTDATFYLLAAHGNISRAYHHNRDYLKAGLEAKKAYSYLKEGFELSRENSEFYFTNGLYRFYRVQYPETHPAIKPIVFFFTEGSKPQGLSDLRYASKSALFSKTEAAFFLAGVCLKYENLVKEAVTVTKRLHLKYPRNPDFLLKYIEALLADGQINLAREKLKKLDSYKGADYEVATLVFKGEISFLEEDFKAADLFFQRALAIKKEAGETADLKSMALCRLGEIGLEQGDGKKAKEYFKQCLDIAEYSRIIKKAELELKRL